MTEYSRGLWHTYTLSGGGTESHVGILGLGFVAKASISGLALASIGGINGVEFTVVDLTETAESTDENVKYRGGIQSVDKGFTASPILLPIPEEFPTGFDIGFVESGIFTISGVWFDGLDGRDQILEDLRTSKKLIHDNYKQSPFVLLLSNRAYPVFITGYSTNILGGQGNVISIRLGLAIASFNGHYNYSG